MTRSRSKPTKPARATSPAPARPVLASSETTQDQAALDPVLREKGLIPLFKREPALLFTFAYLGITSIGIWSSYWFYRHFRISVVEYFQVGDFVVAGLREPVNLLSFAAVLLLIALAYLPTYYEYRHPQHVNQIRKTRWWWRLVFPMSSSPFVQRKWYQLSPEAVVAFMLLSAVFGLTIKHSREKAHAIVEGGGHRVRITLSGEHHPLQGEARLLGTSNGYIYLYWPENGRTEVLVQESVARIETLPRQIAVVEENGETRRDSAR